ncbi:MAG: PRC-barrel domain-containing protein [Pseudomonadales bacterium]
MQREQEAYREKGKVKRVSELMGETVRDAQGEDLGTIEDLALDLQQGRINYVALDTGEWMGLDERLVGIPVEELRAAPDDDGFMANISQREVETAQELPDENWPAQPTVAARDTRNDTEFAPFEAEEPRTHDDDHTMQRDPQTGTMQRDPQTTGTMQHDDPQTGTMQRDPQAGVQPGMQQIHRASELMGETVRDAQGQELGQIEDIAVDLQQGRINYVALDTNGLLTERLVGVPVEALRRAPDDDGFIADISQQELEAARELPDENWPAEPTVATRDMPRDDAEFAPFEEDPARDDTDWQQDEQRQY